MFPFPLLLSLGIINTRRAEQEDTGNAVLEAGKETDD